jgi:hypothetical protein
VSDIVIHSLTTCTSTSHHYLTSPHGTKKRRLLHGIHLTLKRPSMQRRRTSASVPGTLRAESRYVFSRPLCLINSSPCREIYKILPQFQGGSTQHRDLHLSQLITLAWRATKGLSETVFSAYDDTVSKYPRFVRPLKNFSPSLLSFLDTEEVQEA